jgi:hypothetical protein
MTGHERGLFSDTIHEYGYANNRAKLTAAVLAEYSTEPSLISNLPSKASVPLREMMSARDPRSSD